jgi:hypothetical protein
MIKNILFRMFINQPVGVIGLKIEIKQTKQRQTSRSLSNANSVLYHIKTK